MTQGLLPHLTLDDLFRSVKARKEAAYAAPGNFMYRRTSKLKSPDPTQRALQRIREWIPMETEYLDVHKVRISKGSGS